MGYSEVNLQRRTEIENELLQLMKTQSYDSITVKDLTQRLQIARKTFYRYFPNKGACLESLTDRLICECSLEILAKNPSQSDLFRAYGAVTDFWIRHKDFLDVVLQNQLSMFFTDRILQYVLREERSSHSLMHATGVPCDEDILLFFISGEVSLLMKWCREGFPLPLEEMVRKQVRLIRDPLLSPQET